MPVVFPKYCIFILTIVVVGYSFDLNNEWKNQDLYTAISLVARAFHSAGIEGSRYLLFAYYDESSYKMKLFLNNIINEIVKDSKLKDIKVLIRHKKLFYFLRHREVLLLEDMNAFRNFFQFIYDQGNMNLSYTLMFISSIDTYDTVLIQSVFSDLYHMSILNVALIIQLINGEVILVTYFPFSSTACHSAAPIVFNKFDSIRKRWLHTNYFPQKLKNFHGCSLTCASWDKMPYLTLQYDEITKTVTKFNGFGGKLLEFMSTSLNFTTKYYKILEEDQTGTQTEVDLKLGKIFSTHADFAVGAIFSTPNMMQLPFSQTMDYFLSKIFIVCNVRNHYSPHEKLIYPYQTSVWAIIGLLYALSSAIICLLSYLYRKRSHKPGKFMIGAASRTPYYDLFTMAMGASVSAQHMPRTTFPRFLFVCWLLITLVLRIAYQSAMYDMLRTNKQRNPPHTFVDVIQQGYTFLNVGNHSKQVDILSLTDIRTINKATIEQFSQMANSNERLALVTPYEYYGYLHQTDAKIWQRLHLVNERIFSQPVVINVHRQSYLFDAFNGEIAKAKYFGFLQRWERDLFGHLSSQDSYVPEERETSALTMNELVPVFMMLVWLHLMACLVLAMEIIWHGNLFRLLAARIKRL